MTSYHPVQALVCQVLELNLSEIPTSKRTHTFIFLVGHVMYKSIISVDLASFLPVTFGLKVELFLVVAL